MNECMKKYMIVGVNMRMNKTIVQLIIFIMNEKMNKKCDE